MGLGPLAGVGHRAARRRGTTSSRSRGSARSRPAFDLHHPEVAAIELAHNEAAREGRFADAPDMEGREELLEERGAVVTEERPDDDEQPDDDQDGETR